MLVLRFDGLESSGLPMNTSLFVRDEGITGGVSLNTKGDLGTVSSATPNEGTYVVLEWQGN